MFLYKHFRRDISTMENLMRLVQRRFVDASMLCFRANDEDDGRLTLPGENGDTFFTAGAQNQPEPVTALAVEVPRIFSRY
jgi:hypothetical protein